MIDLGADIQHRRQPVEDVAGEARIVAGEMMAGNVLGKGYTAGVGMSIGTTFGRIAGQQAARAAQQETHHEIA